ncbi:unnamed protein product [Plutella xylostella]|uniref:(diamondback moth) hypothetical protein n=1 Tax=Plutella xylostella TaxID=51655 RepID=A0A8S4FT00_PLUXY|nr:unnamed protein product [Plutella xylostella]
MPLKINRNPKEIPQYPLNEHTTANLDCRTGPGQELRTARGSLTALVTNDTFWNREKQPWVKDGSTLKLAGMGTTIYWVIPETNSEEAYNKTHITTRNTVERFFGVWKRRCPCLEKGVTLRKTSTILQVIAACAVLHNICIELNEVEPPNDFQPDEDHQIIPNINIDNQANEHTVKRRTLINSIFS